MFNTEETTSKPCYINSLKFTKDTYKSVFYLHMRPHEIVPGLEMTIVGLIISSLCLFVIKVSIDYNRINLKTFELSLLFAVVLIIFIVFGILQLIYGFKMTVGLRKPRWGTQRWNLREMLTMEKLSSAVTSSPIFDPCVSDNFGILPFWLCIGGWWTTTWDNTPYMYDEIPHILPTKKDLSPKNPEQIPEFVSFSATFFEDYFLKGSSDRTKYKYSNIFDIVEYKKVPDYALIRMNDKETEILIKTDAFVGAEWCDVKEYLLKRREDQKKLVKEERKLVKKEKKARKRRFGNG